MGRLHDMPSLVDSLGPQSPTAKRQGLLPRLRAWEAGLLEKARARWRFQMAEPKRRRRTLLAVRAGGAAAAIALGAAAWLAFMPRAQPDYMSDPLDEVFDYTLLTDEFNALPVEDRLKLIGLLVQRMRGMSAEDSVLLAAFAAGIAGEARKQLEENAARLAIDMWDNYAQDYDKVPQAERSDYLLKTFLEFSKMMETISGEQRDIPDEQRIAEVRRQASRDQDRLRERPPDGEALGRLASFMHNNVAGHASPQQRARGQLMLRDMVREFRGQDLITGKPKGPG
jgi:hypothetical protein